MATEPGFPVKNFSADIFFALPSRSVSGRNKKGENNNGGK